VGCCLLLVEVSRLHTDTPHSVGLLCTRDRPVTESSTLSTHNAQNRRTSMPAAEFKPAVPARELPQTHALDRTATVISLFSNISASIINHFSLHSYARVSIACSAPSERKLLLFNGVFKIKFTEVTFLLLDCELREYTYVCTCNLMFMDPCIVI
jgi:hypothetical protein